MNRLLSWFPIIIPGALFVWGASVFVIRFLRLRHTFKPDPESLVLGAVSHSLRERGELAANLGKLRTVHEKLLDALPFGLLWVDQKGKVGEMNYTGQSLLGLKPSVRGMDAGLVLSASPWLLDALGNPPEKPFRVTDKDSRRWEIRKILVPNGVGALVQFEDVSERENEERRRAIQNGYAELGEMTAGLAHQLKNSLAVLKGQGQLLGRQGFSEAADGIVQEVASLENMASSFLYWARPLTPQCTHVDLAAVADSAMTEISRRPCSSDITLERRGEGEALADPALLREALVNIIENACQVSPPGSKVLLQISDLVVDVLDEGPGLDQSDVGRIFRPFESGRSDGTGLGLPLAFKWLSAQGADLKVSRREGRGSVFSITWQDPSAM